MIKAVLFDLDNTLIDFMRMKRASIDAALNAMLGAGLNMDKEKASKKLYELYSKHGIEHQKIFQKFLGKVMKKVDYKILAAGIVAYRKVQLGVLEPYAMVIPTLIKLREKGLKLAIVSDAPRLRAWIRLVEMRLHDFFDVVVTFEDTRKRKPHKAPFEEALKRLKLKPEECLMVGDWPERDIKGAKELGMKTAFAKYGATKDVASKADYELKSVEDVLKVVEK
jgi:HAD superfamily hydrolase (TIGR02253 family)